MDKRVAQEELLSSSAMDASHSARQRVAVPIFAFGGVLLALMVLVNWGDNWVLNAGLILAGVACLIATYLTRPHTDPSRPTPGRNMKHR